MLICAPGDIHGAMNRPYQDVFAFEASLGHACAVDREGQT
jgi:hypothetical protein